MRRATCIRRDRHGPSDRVRSLFIVGMLLALTGSSTATAQPEQHGLQRQRGVVRIHLGAGDDRASSEPVVGQLVAPPAPITNLFRRAEEGAARRDWKFAIDSLQRIIEDPDGTLMFAEELDGGVYLYEPARREAVRRLRSLPPDGLHTYHLLYDGRAKRLFELGKQSHDPALLRDVVERYPSSAFGDEAADLLASWALDGGRPVEAIHLLAELLELGPNRDVPDELIYGKMAAAWAMLGRKRHAQDAFDAYLQGTMSRVHSNPATAQMQESGEPANESPEELAGADLVRSAVELPPVGLPDEGSVQAALRFGGPPFWWNWQPAVKPLLTDDVPWRYELPNGAGAWRDVIDMNPLAPLDLPAVALAASGPSIFVRTKLGCAALDREDLSAVWTSNVAEDDAEAPPSSTRPPGRLPGSPRGEPSPGEMGDYPTSGVAVAHGLALIVSNAGSGEYSAQSARDAGGPRGLGWIPMPKVLARSPSGNRLVAYDVRTGRVRWQRGRTGDPADPLGDVTFRSVPLGVDAELWVPFVRSRDLYVAILDPADGAIVHQVFLCSLGATADANAADALLMAVSGGTVFVPSGSGALFAIRRDDYRPVWAAEINAAASDARTTEPGAEEAWWLPSPPVVGGGLVMFAAPDAREFVALSAVNGVREWSAHVPNAAYPIAADHNRVWLGGRSVSCLSLDGGSERWLRALPSAPTGRAMLSGRTLLIPLADRMLSLDASTGDVVGQSDLGGDEPLGNLLFLTDAVYSVNSSSVRRFPDIDRTYPRALARHVAQPSDAVAALRLAWLEFLKGDPKRSLELLDTLPRDTLEDATKTANDVAHLQVEALLALADLQRQADAAEHTTLLALLDRAAQIARTPADRYRCDVAGAEQLRRLGRHAEAYRRLWGLGTSVGARLMIPSAGVVEVHARFDIARRLNAVAPALNDEERSLLSALARVAFIAAAQSLRNGDEGAQPRERLVAIADLDALGSAGPRSLLVLADWQVQHEQYEEAEQSLRHCARLFPDAPWRVASQTRICELYGLMGPSLHSEFQACVRQVAAEFERGTPIPVIGLSSDDRRPDDATITVADWLANVGWAPTSNAGAPRTADAIGGAGGAVGDSGGDGQRPDDSADTPIRRIPPREFTGQLAWSLELKPSDEANFQQLGENEELERSLETAAYTGAPRIVHLDNGRSARCQPDRALFLAPDDLLYAQQVDQGQLAWHTRLIAPGSFDPSVPPGRSSPDMGPGIAACDGQTAILASDAGLFAVGLATGRRLWMQPVKKHRTTGDPSRSNIAFATADGFVAVTARGGPLSLMRILDGTTVWQRDLRGEPVDSIWIDQDRVVTVGGRDQRVSIFQRSDGRLVRQVFFQQPGSEGVAVQLVRGGGTLCGPFTDQDGRGVKGIDLTTGETTWEIALDEPLIQLFSPKEGYLGVGLLQGKLRILDAASGDPILERRVDGVQGTVGGALVDGTLLTHNYVVQKRNKFHVLVAQDVATGEEVWRRDDVSPLSGPGEPLSLIGGRLIVFIGPVARSRNVRVTMVDVRTGADAGHEMFLPPSSRAVDHGLDYLVYPEENVLLLALPNGIYALRMQNVVSDPQQGL